MQVRHSRTLALVLFLAASAACSPALSASGSGVSPCGVPYEPSDTTVTAHALVFPASGRAVILYNPQFINWAARRGHGAPMFRYLMQHECGHHVLGHLSALAAGPRSLVGAARHLELEADCYAAKQLAAEGDMQALQAALMLWNSMGSAETGPAHPLGLERSATLSKCYSGGSLPPGF